MSGKTFLFHSDLKPLKYQPIKYHFMKKLLLILTLLVTGLLSASAETVTFNLAKAPESLSQYAYTDNSTPYLPNPTSIEQGAVTLTLDGDKADAWRFWSNGLRGFAKSSKGPKFTVSINGATITALKWATTKNTTYKPATGSVVVTDTEASWTGSASSVTIDYTYTTSNITVFTGDLVVTYEGTAEEKAPRPVITCDDNMVTITAEGADAIYYTTNGEDPTVESTKYNEPFAITSDVTVKAISTKTGAINSDVVTAANLYVPTYANFAEMKDGGADKVSKVTNLKVVYQNGQNLYLYDETNNGMLYFGNYATYAAGTTFTSAKGTYTLYGNSKTPEVTNATFVGQAEGTPVVPEELTAEEASADKQYKYVIMTDVAINNLSGNNFVFTDATGNIAGYNKFNLEEVAVGTGYTVVGIVDVYNNNPQVIPVSVTGGVVTEVVADPVIAPAAGYVKAGTEVTITCETEGAKIYYTTDNVNPTAESTEYTGAFELTASCTVKAIAIKENCVNSKVVSAKYELLAEGENVATYDFTTSGNAENLIDNNEVVPENGNAATNKNGLDGVSFINGPITLTFATGETTSQPRWWKNTNESTELRAYNNNVITLKANKDGFKLVKVLFSGSVNKTVAASIGSYSNGVWEATQEASQDLESNSIVTLLTLTPAATLNINNIHVIYAEDPDATTSAIDSIIVDGDEDAPVEYFNIQGVRVNADRLVPGLYIVRQGSKASKIIVK